MSDVLTPEERHKSMSHIRSKDTSIEVILRQALWKSGIHYRKNYKKLPGKPDIAITKYKIAIFCDGEFFHGKDWTRVLKPKLLHSVHSEFWIQKIEHNIQRDIAVDRILSDMGWITLHFWGKDIKKDVWQCVKIVKDAIQERCTFEECLREYYKNSSSSNMDNKDGDLTELVNRFRECKKYLNRYAAVTSFDFLSSEEICDLTDNYMINLDNAGWKKRKNK